LQLARKIPVRDYIHMRGLSTSAVTVRRPMHRRLRLAMVTAVVALMSMACADKGLSLPVGSAVSLHGEGTLTKPTPTSKADTYNPALAPAGALLIATMTPSGGSTTAELTVSGMLRNRSYAVHAHTNPCGDDPDSVGPDYQNRIDPAATPQAPSTDPEYVNPHNEVWLDMRTDIVGSGTSHTTVPFTFTDRRPGSIVLHQATQTSTALDHVGEAGAPIACLTLSTVQEQNR
jgi:Cu-Zn family superoxide dismutase